MIHLDHIIQHLVEWAVAAFIITGAHLGFRRSACQRVTTALFFTGQLEHFGVPSRSADSCDIRLAIALSKVQVVQSKALSQYLVGTTLARIQIHSFSVKLKPAMPLSFLCGSHCKPPLYGAVLYREDVKPLIFGRSHLTALSRFCGRYGGLFPSRNDRSHIFEHLVERARRAFVVLNAHLEFGGSACQGMNTNRIFCDRIKHSRSLLSCHDGPPWILIRIA